MSSDLTDKTMIVVTRLGDFWVSPDRAARLQAVMDSAESPSIELDGNILRLAAIDGILTAGAYDLMNKKKRGGWQCQYQHWHEKFEQCAHAQLRRG